MPRVVLIFFLVIFTHFLFLKSASAIVDPLSSPNNRFGIHIVDENDLDDAEKLVNSGSGEWGYAILVMTEKDKDQDKWQALFNQMRRKKLIPIVRLATQPEGEKWKKPEKQDAASWADFLNQLNWVVKNRYVILFNEPNHAKEWGGEINPEEYGAIAQVFSTELKNKSQDFFILPAGLDASSANTNSTMEMSMFFERLLKSRPDFFSYIDGWTSHSYPNPNFSASPSRVGKGTIQSYLWEISYLKKLGLAKKLPVFITETGWAHQEGQINDFSYLPSAKTAEFFRFAFVNIWNDENLIVVSPFLLNYQAEPFDHFSWKKINSADYYPQFNAVENLPKIKGEPEQNHQGSILDISLPERLIDFSDHEFAAVLLNNGESIWDRESGFKLNLTSTPSLEGIFIDEISEIEPFQKAKVKIRVKTPKKEGAYNLSLQMQKGNEFFGDLWRKEIVIVPAPKIAIRSKFWFGKGKEKQETSLLIYENNLLLKRFDNLIIKNGAGEIAEVRDIVPNKNYRFVLLSPSYLPSQTFSPLWEEKTIIEFKRMLPFDFSNDGRLSMEDVYAGFKNPKKSFSLLWPF